MKKLLKILISLVFVLAVIFVFLQWRGYNKQKVAFDEGIKYFNEQDYEKSNKIFEEALSYNSLFGKQLRKKILCYEADGYYGLEEYDKALELYTELLDSDSENNSLYLMKGECYQKAGETEKAMDVYLQGWKATKDLKFLNKLATMCIDKNDLEAALSYVNVGLKEGGDDTKDFLFDKIVIYEKQLDYAKAYEAAQEFCEKYPDDEKGLKEKTFLSTRV